MNWNPIRRGPVYCSSACGRGCTWAEYQQAMKAAQACLKRMNTKGWKIHVHENLGWFWKLEKADGLLTVSGGQAQFGQKSDRYFHSMLSTATPHSCDIEWYDNKRFTDPNRAVSHRLRLAREHIARVQALTTFIDKLNQ